MIDIITDTAIFTEAALRRLALSRWDNEGGAGAHPTGSGIVADTIGTDDPVLTNAELVQLRIRVIALENVLIAMLAKVPDAQLDLVLEMADHIAPRPDATRHPLTIRAAAQMTHLINRAGHFGD